MEITDRVAIVTGGASGIGRATARELARAGARGVIVADVDVAGAEETAATVEAEGAAVLVVQTDVADVRAMERLFAAAIDEYGQIDIVHNNAGLVSGDPPWPGTAVDRIEEVVRVNVVGSMVGTRLAIDALRTGEGGVIVNTASVAGLAPLPTDAVYCATKAAIILFTQSCAGLAAEGIRVNAVLPGMVDTPMIAKTGDGTTPAAWLEPLVAGGIDLGAADIASAVRRLVEDDSKAGETVIVLEPVHQ